ncbi:MAG: right-handed parallel beta-helix repeat-containing protein [bacterium]
MILFTSLSMLALLLFTTSIHAAQDSCALPEPFDADAVYQHVLHVSPDGNDQSGDGSAEAPYRTLSRAAREAEPGTRILLSGGDHIPNQFIENLAGTESAPILITNDSDTPAVFRKGSVSIQLSDCRYVILENVVVDSMSGNGINIDDGGSFDTPTEHLILRGITVRNTGPTGNRDAIKLSGVDHFRVENCIIDRAGSGGSGIDMVGCHYGVIAHNVFENIEASGVQAKGGSAHVLIHANEFRSGGSRAINMGGSTGLQFFRPQAAPYEAAHISVIANIFANMDTPVAFVGCENGLFAQNVVYRPRRWAARILQETVGERFVPSRNNIFANNIVVLDTQVSTLVNVGPNTDPESFRFVTNLWFHADYPTFRVVNLPGTQIGSVIQEDPLFINPDEFDFHLQAESPAMNRGAALVDAIGEYDISIPAVGDWNGECWTNPPGIGAFSRSEPAGAPNWSQH